MRKLEIEIAVHSYSGFTQRTKKILLFSPEHEEQDIIYKIDDSISSTYAYSSEFFMNSHIFNINIRNQAVSALEWNNRL